MRLPRTRLPRVQLPAPERRTRLDVGIAAALVVVALVVGAALWWTSDIRDTDVRTAAAPAGPEVPTVPLPPTLREVWRTPSPATERPVVLGDLVVSGSDGTVAGHDPGTGAERWSYRRDLDLCTLDEAFGRALALYLRDDGCSEVTSLDDDGSRGPQRNSDLERDVTLVSEGGAVAVRQERYLEMWRSDLVRTLLYGDLSTPVKPGVQPRTDCLLGRPVIHSGKVAVVETCPADNSDRITVQDADPEDSDKPEITFSTLIPGRLARLVALTDDLVAVAFPDPNRLTVFDLEGKQLAEYPLDVSVAPPDPATDSGAVLVADRLLWQAGSGAVALDAKTLQPVWTAIGALGPGAELGGELVVPVPGGIEVRAVGTGAVLRFVPVDRGSDPGPVQLAGSGATVFEQRGDDLVALR